MSLDQNLFTLVLTPSTDNPNVVDLNDPSGQPYYRKQRVPGPVYRMEMYDPLSQALLATATAPSPTSKTKVLELINPSATVELRYTGTISFRWSFSFEDHQFEWRREECYMLRKPDPPVLVAVTKERPGRLTTSAAQILDYNLQRFDINDRKGLEIVILTALLTFNDQNEVYHSPRAHRARYPSALGQAIGIDRIAELQAVRGQFNEVTVEDEGSVDDYGAYAARLFDDNAMLFITVVSEAAEHVPKVLQVVEEIKRIRHKAGVDEELHQYVLYDTQPRKGPKRINLNDTPKDKYKPPESLTVHLSKISMPELQPKVAAVPPPPPPISVSDLKKEKKEQKRREEAKKKEEKKAANGPPPLPTCLTRPSPSQLNNPGIYAAPPNGYLRSPVGPSLRPQPTEDVRAHRVSGIFDMFHRPRSTS
ncbi:hypothetical protein MKEN_00665500 [Mycena kentingensis (nom. inval.)]|nr:hypothetical protein MKEN_00665500 [Mycena kentingensis (nom. inval.)]